MNCGGLPPVLPDTPSSEHCIVLAFLCCRRVRLGFEAVLHGNAGEWILLRTLVDLGHLQSADIKDCRHDVSGMVILVPHFAAGLDALWPRDHQRVAGTARIL